LAKFIADIGLEVHVELSTRSKMFCSCAVVDNTEALPNTAVCPVCSGMPGTLPVINKNAVELALRAALALQCTVAHTSIFARKNYFYPDLPKGYQISQYEYPLAEHGKMLIRTNQGEKYIRIHRVHLEEDTGKLTHVNKRGEVYSLVNLNRAGVPLLEIVSEPDLHSIEDVAAYSRELRLLLQTIEVSSGDMEKGAMRFEANLSMRPEGNEELGTRVEVKNLNSFRAMENAILYQMEAQKKTLSSGQLVQQQTLGWNEGEGKTFPQRSKENANDYRYFPEPDLPPLIVSDEWISKVRGELYELPNEKRERYMRDYGLKVEDIERLVGDKQSAIFFEDCIRAAPCQNPQVIANWLLADLFAWLNQHEISISKIKISASQFTDLIHFVQTGKINQNTGKVVLHEMLESGSRAAEIIKAKGVQQVSDTGEIGLIVKQTLNNHPNEVNDYLDGKETIANWLFGQAMRAANGKANPQLLKEILEKELSTYRSA
jgi:aspartyl-tRNA(Asn)/glutamyl-tRNA(Gln) amidotransferase subunit B